MFSRSLFWSVCAVGLLIVVPDKQRVVNARGLALHQSGSSCFVFCVLRSCEFPISHLSVRKCASQNVGWLKES